MKNNASDISQMVRRKEDVFFYLNGGSDQLEIWQISWLFRVIYASKTASL